MADPIIIHGIPQSSYVFTTRIACSYKGVPYELVPPTDFKSEEHLARHPFGKVPAYSHGDFTLYETTAITQYIDAAFDGPPLQPADIKARALMTQWVSVACDYLYDDLIRNHVLQFIFPKGADGKPDMAAIEAGHANIRRDLGVLDAALDGAKFFCGDAPTLADFFVAPSIGGLMMIGQGKQLAADFANVQAWFGRVAQIPAFAQSAPPMPAS